MRTIGKLTGFPMVLALAAVGCSTDFSGAADSAGPVGDSEVAKAEVGGVQPTMNVSYPDPSTWSAATERQAARAGRSFERLRSRKAPVYPGPLMVDDDLEVKLQDAQAVARRTLVLWAVELRAEGIPKDEAHGLISQLDLWDDVSPKERKFLEQDDPDPEESQKLVWRLESIWVLLWALGYVDQLDWPGGMCNVQKIVDVLKPREADPTFISNAKLRDVGEILDAQDLTMRIHWAIRDAHLNHEGLVPAGLDWTSAGEPIHLSMSPAVGVVEQRHYVLNWLVNFLSPPGWDHVDTPT